ncbi:MAG TPA: hypothetical protein VF613_17770 [Longimicrobium sp.]|jgi:hypothetical protein
MSDLSVSVPQAGTAARGSFHIGIATLTAAACALFATYLARSVPNAQGLAYSAEGLENLGQVMAPLVLMALFVERACEVVISAWRDPGAQTLQHHVEAAAPDSAPFAQRSLDHYRLNTQRLAFIITCTLALFGALVGVRAIEPLLADGMLAGLRNSNPSQFHWFHRFDIIITALLVGGGADGMHRIVSTFTDFLNSTRKRITDAPPAQG